MGRPMHLRDIVRDYALETLADPDAVLVLDETGFSEAGQRVLRCGDANTQDRPAKITNCPDRRVRRLCVAPWAMRLSTGRCNLPKAWTDDPARMAAAHVPSRHRLCRQASPCPCR